MSNVDPSTFNGVSIDLTVNQKERTVNYLFADIPMTEYLEFFAYLATEDGQKALFATSTVVLHDRGYITAAQRDSFLQAV